MKLAVLALATLLGLSAAAHADNYTGAPGNYDQRTADAPPPQRVHARDQRDPRRAELRRAVLDNFDRDGDGRLSAQERRQAVRALRRMAKRLAREDRRPERRQPRGGNAPNQAPHVDVDINVRP